MKTATLLFATSLVVTPLTSLAQQTREPVPSVIVVNSMSTVEATPDQATVRLGVVRQAPTAQAAQDQTNRAVQAVLTEVGKVGVPAQKIQTSRLTLTPVYAPQQPGNRDAPRIVSYNAANIVSIELDNLTQVGPVIDAGLTAGANQLEGVRFSLKNDTAVRERALKQAVADAKRKAETMAEALGVRITGVLEASDGGVSVIAQDETVAYARVSMAQVAPAATPVSPGEIEVRASVTVRYSIAPLR
jgi:uncharacterized protein YggE